jgi:hypothetical protein
MRRLCRHRAPILAACSAAAAIADAPGWTVSRLEKDAPPEAARDVTGGSLDSAFHNVAAERIARRGWSMWLRVRIETAREAPEPVVLVLRHARTARATLFPPSGKPVSQSLYGDDPHPRFTQDALYFPLGNSLKAGDSYYILVEQLRAGSVAVDLRDMAEVNAANLAHTRTVALTIGAMLVLGLTQLLLFAWLPERAMLYLGGQRDARLGLLRVLLGDGYAWLPSPPRTLVTFNILQVAGSLAVGCDILFFRELLDFGRYERRIRALLKAIAIFYFAEGAMLVAAGGEMLRLLTLLANLGTLLVWVLIVPGMIVGSIRGGNVARLLLGAWALTTLITIPRILSYVRGDRKPRSCTTDSRARSPSGSCSSRARSPSACGCNAGDASSWRATRRKTTSTGSPATAADGLRARRRGGTDDRHQGADRRRETHRRGARRGRGARLRREGPAAHPQRPARRRHARRYRRGRVPGGDARRQCASRRRRGGAHPQARKRERGALRRGLARPHGERRPRLDANRRGSGFIDGAGRCRGRHRRPCRRQPGRRIAGLKRRPTTRRGGAP